MNHHQNATPPMPQSPPPVPTGYWCSRCRGKLKRDANRGAGMLFGLIGALIASAFSPLKCQTCGPIPTNEKGGTEVMTLIAILPNLK
ncbi:hypothetical protein [Pedosphaera parvula]|uniref:Uncharacterized protein n=1 Tax=Pedosphaera parvula (strain Ellin514) TaxID=320771 RepID=B9XBX0_PEDPL|nr:hypothetical protein [Pedosphaera parvula]EEF62438.1 hypothetical protein Cflav_PD5073 [Pedosphaera parvula Ellin514]